MKLILALALVIIVLGAAYRAGGNPLPIIDYPFGPFGQPLIGPAIEIEPPGYDIDLP